ncbi:MAG TPA: hypothetical protein VMH40_19745 [Myxococcaceae bacterium]|nr:hypothetical protein [Myxococcaceae bacterium]
MNRPLPRRGFVLLVILAAIAVLAMIAAFIYSETEDQLLLSVAARGQSLAASRATLAAQRMLAVYRANYPTGAINALLPQVDYPTAVATGQALTQIAPTPPIPNDRAVDLVNGGGAQWCVQVWRMNRGPLPAWTVIESFGFYGYTSGIPTDFINCVPQTGPNATVFSSHVTVYLDATNPGVTGGGGNAAPGTCAAGAC